MKKQILYRNLALFCFLALLLVYLATRYLFESKDVPETIIPVFHILDFPFTVQNTSNNKSPVYCILDTKEGSECVGHWIWECALFLPHLQTIRRIYPNVKVLLRSKKRFKTNILSDFGVAERDIVYNETMTTVEPWQMNHVLPKEQEYIAFLPQFYYLHSITTQSAHFFHAVNRFREFYGTQQEKTIPIVYVRRSEKENYSFNSRKFLNMEPVLQMLNENSVQILDVDKFASLKPQVDIIQQANVIVVEMGSALLINGCLFATNSHIIILNDFENLTESQFSYIQVYKKLLLDHNNTYELFLSKSKHTTDPFYVDIDRLRSRIHNWNVSCSKIRELNNQTSTISTVEEIPCS